MRLRARKKLIEHLADHCAPHGHAKAFSLVFSCSEATPAGMLDEVVDRFKAKVVKGSSSESWMRWALTIFGGATRFAGDNMIKHEDELVRIIRVVSITRSAKCEG